MKLRHNTLVAISAVFSSLFHIGQAVSEVALRSSAEGAEADTANDGLPERNLRLQETIKEDYGDDLILSDPIRYSDEKYDLEDQKLLCKKFCPRGDLAVSIKGVCTCLKPCSKVCRSFSIVCNGSYGEGSIWADMEGLRCWQWERYHGVYVIDPSGGLPVYKRKLRITCKCPERDYSVSNACQPWTQANLSNCIKGEITNDGAYEINFGDLTNVQIGHVHATGTYVEGPDTKGYDIDFQGDVTGSHFCELESDEGDLEFGGEACPIHFSSNSVMNVNLGWVNTGGVKGGDFKFEEGAWVTNNSFGDVAATDDFQFNGSTGAIRTTVIVDNSFGVIDIDDECNYNNGQDPADVDISGNGCTSLDMGDPSDCGDVFAGFSC